MIEMTSVSRTQLEGRRKKLRRRRQNKICLLIWRSFTVSGLAGGLLWLVIQPMWVLKAPQEIVVVGNKLLTHEAIQSQLALSYPRSLWRIEPYKIAEELEAQPMIVRADVNRRLFPPGLVIQVKERVPVAIASLPPDLNSKQTPNVTKSDDPHGSIIGLLDANGVLISVDKSQSIYNQDLPSLKVFGVPQQYLPYWNQIYLALSQSAVKIMAIDFQNPTNLILNTELGLVHFGVPDSQLAEKIQVMAQIRGIGSQLNLAQIKYIDLKNPDSPMVQMNHKKRKVNPNSKKTK